LRAEHSNTRRQSENSTCHVKRKIDELTTNLKIYIHSMKSPTSVLSMVPMWPATRARQVRIGGLSKIFQQSVPTKQHSAQLDTVSRRSLQIGISVSSIFPLCRLPSEPCKFLRGSSRLVMAAIVGTATIVSADSRHAVTVALPTLVSRFGTSRTSGRTVSLLMYPPLCKMSNS